MKKIISRIFAFLVIPTTFFLLPTPVSAVCPVCTVAVIAGLGLSRYLGIDDSISGIWIGGLLVSLSFWTKDWIVKRNWKFLEKIKPRIILAVTFVLYVLITFLPLQAAGILGHPFNKIMGVDKLIFGSVLGTLVFLGGVFIDKKERQIKGHQLFPYQKVAFPVISLIIASLLVFYYGGYLK